MKYNTNLVIPIFFVASVVHASDAHIVATEHYPPYEMKEAVDGLKGFDYDVLLEIAADMNIDLDIQFLPWKRAIQYTKSGKVLGILTCAHTKEREDFIVYSDPISEFTNGLYTRTGFSGIKPKTIEDIVGQKVGSVDGYESLFALQKVGANPIPAPNTSSAIDMLFSQRFDYLSLAKQSTDFVIKQKEKSGYFDFYPTDTKSFYFCFSKSYPKLGNLVKEFNLSLKRLKESGRYDAIHSKYR